MKNKIKMFKTLHPAPAWVAGTYHKDKKDIKEMNWTQEGIQVISVRAGLPPITVLFPWVNIGFVEFHPAEEPEPKAKSKKSKED